jgi:hypothetical protein
LLVDQEIVDVTDPAVGGVDVKAAHPVRLVKHWRFLLRPSGGNAGGR